MIAVDVEDFYVCVQNVKFKVAHFALGMAVELFFIFNCHGFKPVAIENKKSGNVQPDHAGTIVEAWECPKFIP
jgi:hypothetical protein